MPDIDSVTPLSDGLASTNLDSDKVEIPEEMPDMDDIPDMDDEDDLGGGGLVEEEDEAALKPTVRIALVSFPFSFSFAISHSDSFPSKNFRN